MFYVVVVAKGFAPAVLKKLDPRTGPFEVSLEPRVGSSAPPTQVLLGRVVGSDHKPIPNAIVSVEQTATSGGYTVGSSPKGTDPVALTDELGRFELRCPQSFESMDLQIEAEGFARRYFAELRPGYEPQALALGVGAKLSGRVVWRGKGVPGIAIGVAQADRSYRQWVGAFSTGTDADGRFTLYNLPADREYEVYGLMESVRPLGALPVRAFQVKTNGSANDVGTLEILPGLRLAGQVRLSNTNMIPVNTRLFVDRTRGAADFTSVELGPDGRFGFTNLPRETLQVSVSLSGYRHSALNGSLDPQNPTRLIGRLDSDKTDLTIVVEPGEYRVGQFSSDSTGERFDQLPLCGIESPRNRWVFAGHVQDADTEAPLPGFVITLKRQGDWRLGSARPEDSRCLCTNGTFALVAARFGGPVVIKLEAEGYRPIFSEPLARPGSNYIFRLKKGGGPYGTVRSAAGQPVAHAEVCYLAGPEQGSVEGGVFRFGHDKVLLTDTEGRFSFPPKAGPSELIAVNSNGFARLPVSTLDTNQCITLRPWGRVSGRLLKTSSTNPAPNLSLVAEVEFKPTRPRLYLSAGTTPGSDGRFCFPQVAPGRWRLVWDGHRRTEFSVQPGESVDLGDIQATSPP